MNKFIDLTQMDAWQLWLLVVIGVLLVIVGFRIKKVAFFVIWFVLGVLLLRYFMPTIENALPAVRENTMWQWVIPLGGGLLVSLLGFTVEKLCLGGLCFALVLMATAQYFGTEIQTMAIGAVVGVIAAGASTMLMKPATIVATAAGGAYIMTVALLQLYPQINAEAFYWPMVGGITAVGSLIQFVTTRHE